MEDPLQYTKDEIIKNLILTETHLKQAATGLDEQFCQDCLDKHFYNLEGLGDEGIGFAKNKNEINLFSEVATTAKGFRGKDYKKHGAEFAQKVRNLRKSLIKECPNCKTLSRKEIESLTEKEKGLNNPDDFNNYTHKSGSHLYDYNNKLNRNNKMAKINYAELGLMNAGQFAAEGIRYVSETYPTTEPGKYDKYVTIGGGIGLQFLGAFVKLPRVVKQLSLIAGSNLLASGVIKMVKAEPAPVIARANIAPVALGTGTPQVGKAFGNGAGKQFVGRVTATGIPTQYARAGILAGAQAFGVPEHADLIRVD